MKFQKLSLVVVLAAAWGCAGNDAVNIGDDQETPKAKTGELLSDYAATWDGYTEAYKFGSGSDRLRIELDDEGNGTVVLGEGVPPPLVTDPNDTGFLLAGWVEGFQYSVQNAVVHDKRLQLAFDAEEIYKPLCEPLTPVRDTSGAPDAPEYGCLPYFSGWRNEGGQCWGTDFQTGEDVETDCTLLRLCWGYDAMCACTAEGCTVPPLPATGGSTHRSAVLDTALDDGGDSLVGTLVVGGNMTVRMERE
jgi:hypothetical protein